MIATIKMYIASDDFEITYHIPSVLHGVLMSVIDSDYAQHLHMNRLNPYSMFISKNNGQWCWTVSAVGREACEKIINVLADNSFKEFVITHKNNARVNILKKELFTVSSSDFIASATGADNSKYIKLRFISPTAFKSNNRYVCFPDLYLIYNSLMNKASLLSQDTSFADEDTLNSLVESSRITSYRLHTTVFNLEGIRIIGFVGTVTIKIDGPSIMRSFAKILFRAGTLLGVGIKTSLGMGAIEILDKEEGEVNE